MRNASRSDLWNGIFPPVGPFSFSFLVIHLHDAIVLRTLSSSSYIPAIDKITKTCWKPTKEENLKKKKKKKLNHPPRLSSFSPVKKKGEEADFQKTDTLGQSPKNQIWLGCLWLRRT